MSFRLLAKVLGVVGTTLLGIGAPFLPESYQQIALYLGILLLFLAAIAFLINKLLTFFKPPPHEAHTIEKAYLDELWKATLAIQTVAQGYLPPDKAGPTIEQFAQASELFLQFPDVHDLLLAIENNCTTLAMFASPTATPDETKRTALRTQTLADIETLNVNRHAILTPIRG